MHLQYILTWILLSKLPGKTSASLGVINDQLTHYETLHSSDIRKIVKRSFENDTIRHIQFSAFGRYFNVQLMKKTQLLSDGMKVYVLDENDHERVADVKNLFIEIGFLEGEKNTSKAYVMWDEEEALFAAIFTKNETYIIEPLSRYVNETDQNLKPGDMIVYLAFDLVNKLGAYCGIGTPPNNDSNQDDGWKENTFLSDYLIREYDRNQTVCELLLVADYRFYQTVGNSDISRSSRYMVFVMNLVDEIFRKSNFPGYFNLGFEIKKIIVHEAPSITRNRHYNKLKDNWSDEDLLQAFGSNRDYKDYCLAHLFTHVNLGSSLGMAYIAYKKQRNTHGGICSQLIMGHRTFSSNIGYSNIRNLDGTQMLPLSAMRITAHEMGHSWGSPHDPEACSSPSTDGGLFLMSPQTTSGTDENNKLFSECSLQYIGEILDERAAICFKVPSSLRNSICGNGVLELGEECDGGYCCSESCVKQQVNDKGECVLNTDDNRMFKASDMIYWLPAMLMFVLIFLLWCVLSMIHYALTG